MKRVVFIDRDGTIIREPADEQIDTLEKLEWLPGIVAGLKLLSDSGYSLVLVSNQDGLGSRSYPRAAFNMVQGKILRLLEGEGITFEKILICPHRPSARCKCRKPQTKLVADYLRPGRIDRRTSFVLGDRETDVELAANMGIRAVRICRRTKTRAEYSTPDAYQACRFIARAARSTTLDRTTAETDITVSVVLDGQGTSRCATGLGFFDHMLSQVAKHSGIDVDIRARGDLNVDEHHTMEDTGIALGTAIRQALGDKKGIGRFGFWAPLDEAVAQCVLDIGGRSFCSVECTFRREKIGDVPTECFEDFFRAFAGGLGANLHLRCTGRNEHHKAEAMFKALGRALGMAVRIDRRRTATLPTTKGLI
jgi:imidazoleglycerol-phosphate dehydratase / histidinol-phosphatase